MDTNRIETLKQRIRADINGAIKDLSRENRPAIAQQTPTPHYEDRRTTVLTARYLLLGMVLGLLTAIMLIHAQGDVDAVDSVQQFDTTLTREVTVLRSTIDDILFGTLFKREPDQIPLP